MVCFPFRPARLSLRSFRFPKLNIFPFPVSVSPSSPAAADIVLTTLNAAWQHCAFGLRYLMANLGPLQERAAMLEFTINQRPLDIVEAILAREPRIVGFGVYIWNATETTRVVAALKRLRPELIVILGGPEVSHECDRQEITRLADYVITGEADLTFPEVCAQLLAGERPPLKIITSRLPKMEELVLPYHLYTPEDAARRLVYLEASRGCPFTCEFCLSSLDVPVRAVGLDRLRPELERLLALGVRHFKFVDRTFNLNLSHSRALLEFFLERWRPGLFLHFEMIPDRLPEGLREVIKKFPPGAMQFEIGIQTFDETASRNISRRNNHAKLEENFRFLRAETGVHLHADLIAGLPGEDLETFGRGFDRLAALHPQEIQVGILKRLRGTPITRHDAEWGMVYAEHPPYEILRTKLISFSDMQRLRRFAKYWDLVGNSGNFTEIRVLLGRTPAGEEESLFQNMMALGDWLWARAGQTDGLSLLRLMELVFVFLTEERGHPAETVASTLWRDFTRAGRTDRPPGWLAKHLPREAASSSSRKMKSGVKTVNAKRQERHAAALDTLENVPEEPVV